MLLTTPIFTLGSLGSLAGAVPNIWLCADDLALVGAAASTPADGSAVASWLSRCLAAYTTTAPVFTEATNKPLYKTGIQNGLPGVLFDGTNDLLNSGEGWGGVMSVNEGTVIVVCKPTAEAGGTFTAYTRPQLIATTSQTNGISVVGGGGVNYFNSWNYDADGAKEVATGTLAVNSMALVMAWRQNGFTNISLNGVAATPVVCRNIAPAGTIELGTSGASAFYTGYLFEIMVFPLALSAEVRNAIASYLRGRWAF